MKMRKFKKEEKIAEEERKRKENDEIFTAWLAKKNEQARSKKMQSHVYTGFNKRRFSAPATQL